MSGEVAGASLLDLTGSLNLHVGTSDHLVITQYAIAIFFPPFKGEVLAEWDCWLNITTVAIFGEPMVSDGAGQECSQHLRGGSEQSPVGFCPLCPQCLQIQSRVPGAAIACRPSCWKALGSLLCLSAGIISLLPLLS